MSHFQCVHVRTHILQIYLALLAGSLLEIKHLQNIKKHHKEETQFLLTEKVHKLPQ